MDISRRSIALLFFVIALSAQLGTARATPKVAVLSFGNTSTGRSVTAAMAKLIAAETDVTLVDRDLAQAAARGVGYSGSLNLTLQEARDLGAAIGCDFYFTGDAQTVRRSPSTGSPYFEAYAAVFLVSSRSGRLIVWERPSSEGATAEQAEQSLLAQISNTESRRHYQLSLKKAQQDEISQLQIGNERDTPLIEEAPASENEQSGLRLPRPYRRLRPAYPDSAARADAEGVVDVLLDLDKDGEISRVEVARWAGFGLDEATVNTVRQLHFFPAHRDGVPIPMRVLLRYNFRKPVGP